MKTWLTISALVATALMAATSWAQQQSPPCPDLITCQFRVLDLKDYREYLEDQVSRMRTILSQISRQVSDKDVEIKALKDKCGERCAEKKPTEKTPQVPQP